MTASVVHKLSKYCIVFTDPCIAKELVFEAPWQFTIQARHWHCDFFVAG